MRVTMLVRCLAMMRGGGETRHLAWMRELTALGVEVDVITGQPLLLGGARFPVAGVTHTMLRSPYLRDWVYTFQRKRGFGRLTMDALHLDEEWFCRAAWREIASRRHAPDVVHAHALYQAARLRRGSSAVVLNFPGEPNPRYAADIALADGLIADGWAAAELPAKLGHPVHAVPKGVDADWFRPAGPNLRRELGLEHKRVILGVGRLVPIKNMTLLVDAFARVAQSDPSAHLVLVGEGPEQASLVALAGRHGVSKRVTFVGYVPQDQLGPYYRTADLFVLSSDFDNSPNVVLEAMACGLPAISTNVGGAAEYIVPGQGGDLVAARDQMALAGVIEDWLSDADRRQNAGRFNRQRVVQQFSWRASAQRLLEVYQTVIAERHAVRGARVKVALRDDDTCFFTSPETLERVYHDVWDRLPVCLATVPFAVGYERKGIPPEHWHSGVSFPIEQNAALVPFLKTQLAAKRVTIALHGYTHQDYPEGFEFQAAPDPERRVREGLAYLQATLGSSISVFVPPHNALSKRGLAAVSDAGLNLLGSFLSFRPSMRPWDGQTLWNWWRVRAYRSASGRSKADQFVYPFVLRYARHAEFGCHSLIPGTTVESLMAGFEEAQRVGGDFCVATHYWEVDQTLKEVLMRFLDRIERVPGVQFGPAEALFA